jgi:copper chaperone CopZ
MKTTVLINGIHCALCEALVKDVSLAFPAIQSVDIDLHSKRVILSHDGHFKLSPWKQIVESLNPLYRVLPLFHAHR